MCVCVCVPILLPLRCPFFCLLSSTFVLLLLGSADLVMHIFQQVSVIVGLYPHTQGTHLTSICSGGQLCSGARV